MTERISASDFQDLLRQAGNDTRKVKLPTPPVTHSSEVLTQLAELDMLLQDASADVTVMQAHNNAIIRKQARFRVFGREKRRGH
jgi:hypothetical protein